MQLWICVCCFLYTVLFFSTFVFRARKKWCTLAVALMKYAVLSTHYGFPSPLTTVVFVDSFSFSLRPSRWILPLPLCFSRQPALFIVVAAVVVTLYMLRVTHVGSNFFHASRTSNDKNAKRSPAPICIRSHVHTTYNVYMPLYVNMYVLFVFDCKLLEKRDSSKKFWKLKQVKLHTLYAIIHSLTVICTHTHAPMSLLNDFCA